MIRPDDDEKPFVARWNRLVRVLLIPTSVKEVARAAMDHAKINDPTNVYPGNDRLARVTGLSTRSVQSAWTVLRGLEMANRVYRGDPRRGQADHYHLAIPDNWRGAAILGPNEGSFKCVHCQSEFNPGDCLSGDSTEQVVYWQLEKPCFCPPPRKTKGRTVNGREVISCRVAWDKARVKARQPPWDRLRPDGKGHSPRWDLFYKARDDPW